MDAASTAPAIAAVLAAAVTGWFAWAARRSAAQSPESVALGYSKLVADLRMQVEILAGRVTELEKDRTIDHTRIIVLERQVEWLLPRLTDADRAEFLSEFRIISLPPKDGI
jgi:hypothetical protein